MDKQLFDDAIGEVPPSTIDVDAAIARGRRAARLRRVANPAVAAGVAVLLLTGVVAYTMTQGSGGGSGGVAAGTQPATSSARSSASAPSTVPGSTVPGSSTPGGPTMLTPADDAVPPPQCDATDLETADQASTRLSQAAKTALHKQRADLELLPNPEAAFPTGVQHGALEFYQINTDKPGAKLPICDPRGYVMAMATTRGADGDGSLLVTVSPAFRAPGKEMVCSGATEETYCEVVPGGRGEVIVKSTFRFGGGLISNRVQIVRRDGTELLVQAENVGSTSKNATPPTATTPPLTHDQLVAIATDPTLTIFPE